MATATGFVATRRGRMLRLSGILVLLFSLMAAATRPAYAGYEWCSVDPILWLQRTGSLDPQLLDVQVMLPPFVLPLAGVATLTVDLPSDVRGTEILNTSTPLFRLETVFRSLNAKSTSDRFPVDLTLEVPYVGESFPVRLVVTDSGTGRVTIVDGMAGQKVRTSVEVVP